VLKKRVIGVITVRNGWAVQSFGFERYLPLGRPEWIAENLDRWGVDEIMVSCIDRSRKGVGPDFDLLNRLNTLGLSTPLTYSGGIHSVEQAARVVESGAERVCLDAVLHANPDAVECMAALLGAQALIAALPLQISDQKMSWYDYQRKSYAPIAKEVLALFSEGYISEALIIDRKNEGKLGGFDPGLVEKFPDSKVSLILFGGISDPAQIQTLLSLPQVVAIGVGNFLNYSEHAVQHLKISADVSSLRPASYFRTS
jgi:cyclase